MSSEMALAIRQLVQARGISEDLIVKTVEDVLLAAYKRRFGTADNAVIRFNDDATDVTIYAQKRIVAVVDDPVTEIGLDDALGYDEQAEIGDELLIEINPRDFDRVSIQSAKQRARQTLREIQKDTLYSEYEDKVGEMIIGYHQRERNGAIFVDLGKTEGVMPRKYQSPREVYRPNDRIRALIYEVEKTPTGLQIVLSRTHTQFVRKIFELEVPEIYDGTIEIYKMVREPGYRTKMAVYSTRDDVDPVGACVGMRGARIQAVVRELEGEKIDVLKYDPDPAAFIRNALQPAEVEEVIIVDDATRHALAVVHDAQFSLAIGRQGLNVRLANRLVDWNIDVKTRAQVADMDLGGEKKREAAALFSEDEAQEIDRISELPGVPERIAAALAEQGVERIEDLVEMSDDQLAATRGLTSEDISTIRNLLDETVEIVEEDEEDEMGEAPPPAVQADEPAAEPAAEPEPEPADDVAEEVEEITAVSELGLKQHVTDALAAAGVHQAEALMSMSEAELAGVTGLSPDDVKGIRQLIDESVVIIEEPSEGDE
ncbi:MAG: transcription termination factor NusA [Spirochaetaceae bacterium]|nr:transcription termination factor NusA [Spirochaetaceae bacterium]